MWKWLSTKELHPITPTSKKHVCNHVKASSSFSFFFFSFLFLFLLIFLFLFKINTLFNLVVQVLHLTKHGFYNLHTSVHDWRVTVMRWLFMHFSYDFLVLSIKRMWHQNQEHVFKNHKQLKQYKPYIAQTSKVRKNKAHQN